jgi:hypothetical protein
MFNRRNLIAMTVMIIGLFMFVPIAQAERQEFEGIACYSNTHTPIQASPGDIYIGGFEGKGIFRSISKPYFESTFHHTGVLKAQGGVYSWNGLQKNMRADGDFTISEFSGDSVSGATMKLIYGTGRFKGATGEQKVTMITKAKPIVVGTEQVCSQVVGWMELAK